MELYKCQEEKDKLFLQQCRNTDIFRTMISEHLDTLTIKDTYIICENHEMRGLFSPKISNQTGILISYPLLYLKPYSVMKNGQMICGAINFTFMQLNIELMRIQIYSNNTRMLTMMENLKIHYDGIIYGSKRIGLDRINLLNFSLSARQYRKVKEKYYGLLFF